MTTPVKPRRFRLRKDFSAEPAGAGGRPEQAPKAPEKAPAAAVPPAKSDAAQPAQAAPKPANPSDMAQPEAVRAAAPDAPPAKQDAAKSPAKDTAQDPLAAIRAEGLSARQLRMAMRVAQKHGIRAPSAYEAVLQLRRKGIDPFARSTAIDAVATPEDTGRDLVPRAETAPAKKKDIAKTDPVASAKDRMAALAAEREKEVKAVQRQIAKRRKKRMVLLGTRLLAFVTLPTFLVSWYFYVIATPMYATESEFIIQQADSQAALGGGLGGMLPSAAGLGLGGMQEAASVQSFLQSRGAMLRLDREEGLRAHFSGPELDVLRRLSADASDEKLFKLYKRHIRIGFDPTEGVVRMEVIAASSQDSERFARALVRYAEEHVDMMTQRLRDSQMNDARQSLEDAQMALVLARQAAVDLQEQSSVISGEVELSLISQRIVALETELTQTRFSLEELRANPRPNPARLQPLERREEALRREIDMLRDSMTQGSSEGLSLARIQSLLIMAEAEVQTREMMRAQAMQQMESARIEVSRQVRYLALTVEPIAPDEPTYPRKLENSALAFVVFLGLYLFLSMTWSVLREQVAG